MSDYHGGQSVKTGLYCNSTTWELESVTREGILPGTEEARYRRLPLPTVMVIGPLIGLAYVLSLPVIFVLVSGYLLTRKTGQRLLATGNRFWSHLYVPPRGR